jgi:phytoene dehydrogenase-like protein
VFDPKNYASHDVIVRDVAVIGGGSSGTYAAINLRKMGKSVVVVEKEDVLGGHTNTYTDPTTAVTVDYGVQAFLNSSITLDYFAHFNIPLVKYTGSNVQIRPADFSTGQPVVFNPSQDLTQWAQQLAKYPWLD